MTSVKEKILSFFAARPRHRFKPADIQRKIGENTRELHAVLEALRQLAQEGGLSGARGITTDFRKVRISSPEEFMPIRTGTAF
jgi:hypothetical protein